MNYIRQELKKNSHSNVNTPFMQFCGTEKCFSYTYNY